MLKRYLLIPTIWILILILWALPAVAEMIVDTAWVRRYNGTGDPFREDGAEQVVVDDSGNVYVTGFSRNATGHDYDYLTVKYYPNGDTAWVRRYDRPGNMDWPEALAVDLNGNVHVTGQSEGSCLTIKYYPDGQIAWVRTLDGSAGGLDIVTDDSGNVYVTGFGPNPLASNHDYCTIKYHPDGDTAWVRKYNGPGDDDDLALAMALDQLGNVYVTGYSLGIGDYNYDYATVKYYPNGETAWVSRYNGPGGWDDQARDIAVDASGNIWVTGDCWNGTDYDCATIKYYPNGDTAWVRLSTWYPDHDDYAMALAVGDSGNVYVTGPNGVDCVTIGYRPNGDTIWVREFNGPENGADEPTAIATDALGNIYVTGYIPGVSYDWVSVKYYPSGDTAWARIYNGPGDDIDYAYSIATDDYGNVYVTGYSYGVGTQFDFATIKYFQALRGDVNRDAAIDVGDVVYLINYLYKAGPAPEYMVTGDCNCDETVDVGDVVFLINYLFRNGDPPDC